jgi:outer membrane lipoprotein LolB
VVRAGPGFAAAALLAACAAIPDPSTPPPGGFELSGRVAIRFGSEAASGRIFWRHSDDADELLVASPLGQGIARITRERDEYRVVTGDGKVTIASDPENLTEQAFGWRLPLSGLPDWVRGRASPDRPAETRGAPGRDLELRQDGWHVVYEEFREGRPFRLRLSRADLEIRLVVDRWTD